MNTTDRLDQITTLVQDMTSKANDDIVGLRSSVLYLQKIVVQLLLVCKEQDGQIAKLSREKVNKNR